MDIDKILALWGTDPVHLTTATYRILAKKIVEKVETLLSEPVEREPAGSQLLHKRKPDQRDSWVKGTQAVAKRVERGRGWSRGEQTSYGRQRPWLRGHTRSGRGGRFGRTRQGH
jgi:hypothetical protein